MRREASKPSMIGMCTSISTMSYTFFSSSCAITSPCISALCALI